MTDNQSLERDVELLATTASIINTPEGISLQIHELIETTIESLKLGRTKGAREYVEELSTACTTYPQGMELIFSLYLHKIDEDIAHHKSRSVNVETRWLLDLADKHENKTTIKGILVLLGQYSTRDNAYLQMLEEFTTRYEDNSGIKFYLECEKERIGKSWEKGEKPVIIMKDFFERCKRYGITTLVKELAETLLENPCIPEFQRGQKNLFATCYELSLTDIRKKYIKGLAANLKSQSPRYRLKWREVLQEAKEISGESAAELTPLFAQYIRKYASSQTNSRIFREEVVFLSKIVENHPGAEEIMRPIVQEYVGVFQGILEEGNIRLANICSQEISELCKKYSLGDLMPDVIKTYETYLEDGRAKRSYRNVIRTIHQLKFDNGI